MYAFNPRQTLSKVVFIVCAAKSKVWASIKKNE